MMQAYAEGWELLEKVDLVDNVTEVFRSWREGTVIRSWLLDLLVAALDDDAAPGRDPRLRRGLRRGSLDRRGRHRPRRADARRSPPRCSPGSSPARTTRPAMKAVAAMRNQFGGHAVRTAPPAGGDAPDAATRRGSGRVYVAHLSLHDFRSYADVDVELGPGRRRRSSAATGRARPTWSRRSTTSPGSPPTGSPPTRRWCAPAPTRRWSAPRWCATGAPPSSRSRSTRAASNRARVNRSPLPRARELLGLVRTVVFSPEDLALVKGDPSRAAPLPRRPAGAAHAAAGRRARRLRPGAQAAQLPAQDRRRRRGAGRPSQEAALSTLGGLGRRTWPGPVPSCWPRGCALVDELRPYVGKAYETVARGASRDDADIEYRSSFDLAGSAPTGPRSTEALLAELERRRKRRARPRHLPGRPAPRRAAADPGHGELRLPVQGLRLARGVLVVRAGAAAGVVRPAARRRRRPDPDPRRRVRRARLRATRAAGRAGRRRRAGAGHRRGRRRRAARRWPGPATSWPTGEVTRER